MHTVASDAIFVNKKSSVAVCVASFNLYFAENSIVIDVEIVAFANKRIALQTGFKMGVERRRINLKKLDDFSKKISQKIFGQIFRKKNSPLNGF